MELASFPAYLVVLIKAPKKGLGKAKGKQTAPKPKQPPSKPQSRPRDGDSSSSEEDDCNADQQGILDQLAEMEQAFGISPGGPLPERVSGKGTKQSAQRRFTSQAHNCLSLLHAQKLAFSVPGSGDPSMPNPVQLAAQHRGRDMHGLASQVIPHSQSQSFGPGEYLAPQNTNWVWTWGQGNQVATPSTYSSVPSLWASYPSCVGQVGQGDTSNLLCNTSVAPLPQYGMGVVPQVDGAV